jgi:hypothetical protein
MKQFSPFKNSEMKTDDTIITTGIGRRYITAVAAALLLTGLIAQTATAQDSRRGGERSGDGREGGSRQSTMRVQPGRNQGGNERRQDVAVNRNNSGRDFNNNRSPVNIERNINRDRGNNAAIPDRNFNRNRNNSPFFNRDRNNNPAVRNRDFNRNRDIDRNTRNDRNFNGNRFGTSGYNNRPVTGTLSRPGYRPVYGYNRNPVYDAHNPCWRYGYLPRRNSYFYTLPSSYFSISFGGIGYRYWDGVFYRPYNNLFTVIAPPIGIFINVLPVGYRRIYVHDYTYYYYNGTYYDQRGNDYYVVSPPVGAVVESLPAGYETVVIDGETFYTADGAQYKPVVQQNGEIWYEVIKAN